MKSKIKAALINRFKNLGFGDKAFDGVAEYLSKTVTEETQIETSIAGVELLLKSFQGDIDKQRQENADLKKENDELKAAAEAEPGGDKKKPGDGNQEDKDKEQPAWAKAILDKVEKLESGIGKYEQDKVGATRLASFTEKIKDLPEYLKASKLNDFNRMSFKDDADFDTYITAVETDVKTVVQSMADAGLKDFPKPGTGGEGKTEVDGFCTTMKAINTPPATK